MRTKIVHLTNGVQNFSMRDFQIQGHLTSEVEISADHDVVLQMTKFGFGGGKTGTWSYSHKESRKMPDNFLTFFTLMRDGLINLSITSSAECTITVWYSKVERRFSLYTDKLNEIHRNAERNYYKRFYQRKGDTFFWDVEKFWELHPRHKELADLITRKETRLAKCNELVRIPRNGCVITKIEITPKDKWPTKCIFHNGYDEILSFDIEEGKKVYSLYVMVLWCQFTELLLKFDADVKFTVQSELLPLSLRVLNNKFPVVIFQKGVYHVYINGMCVIDDEFLQENGYEDLSPGAL